MTSRFATSIRIIALVLFCVGVAAHAQLNYTTNWIGNSFGGNNVSGNNMLHVPDFLDGMYVTPAGEVYTNGLWDEGGRALSIYQNGQIISTYNDNVPDGEGVAADSNYIYASNSPNGTGVTLVVQSTMADASQTLNGSSTLGNSYDIYQMVVWNGNLYVAEDDQNVVDVFSTSSYALTKSYSITDPAHIAIDSSGNLWVSHMDHTPLPSINGIISNYWGDFGKNTIDEYNSSGAHVRTLTLGSGVEVSALWIDSSNNLYIGDEGANQNILVYKNLSGTPVLSQTLGATGGFLNSSTPGVLSSSSLTSATFFDITGIGTDSSGNIYVGDNQYSHGTDVYSFAPSGSLNWQVSSQEFVSAGAVDPTSETDFYDAYHHFKLNYNNVPGNVGTYYANTLNPFKYPGDPRATQTTNTGRVQYVQGHKLLLVSNQAGSIFAVYRFNSGSETAIPSTVFDYGSFNNEYVDLYGEPSNGEFIWYDANGDGQVQSNEFLQPNNAQFGNGQSWWMDTNGDVWQVINGALRRYLFQGFDNNGTPLYNYNHIDTYTQSGDFPALSSVSFAVFQPSESQYGTLYLAGSLGDYGYTQVARYDNWENGNRTASWVANIPNSSSIIVNSFAETNGYFFVDYNTPHYISVYSTADGSYTGQIDAGSNVGGDPSIGNDDEWQSMSVYQRSNGQYVVTKEEDFQAKLLAYIWTPPGAQSQAATPTFSPAGGTYTSAQSVTISDSTSGATIYYTTNGTTPTTSSTKYTGPVSVPSSETIKAIATASGYTTSNVGSATYTITSNPAATPTFSPAAGTYTSAQSVTISDSTSGATIYYTTNGTTPTTGSTKYTGPIAVASSETIEAIATASGYTTSAVGTAAYTISTGGSGPVVEINAGGSAVSGTSWVADTDVSGGAVETWTNSINTGNVTNPAPTAVYQSDHFANGAGSFTYTIPGLTVGSSYTVRLHFCEDFWTAPGDRVFNVSINGTSVLSNFDIYKTAGGKGIANIQQFTATANSSGQVVIVFTTVTDNAAVNGIEIDGAPPSGPVNEINAGGPAVSGTNWVADTDYSGGAGETWTNSINTSNVTNPAPTAVYQSDHFANGASSFTYTVPNLTAGSTYTVRLHFCEDFWTAAGDRVFNVSINGTSVLSNFDIYKTAGGKGIANIQQFTATANSSGKIVIVFTTVTDNAAVNGIEIDH